MVAIRLAKQSDLESIVEIFNQAIPTNRSTGFISLLTVFDIQEWFNKHKPGFYPIYVAEINEQVIGWSSISAYREKRLAFRYTGEISYYVDNRFHRQGVATQMVDFVISVCPELQIKTLIAYVLDQNEASIGLMNKFGFELWGKLPNIADFDGRECGHEIFGKRIYT